MTMSLANGQKKTPAQLDQLASLICRSDSERTHAVNYRLPTYSAGSTSISENTVTKRWCPPQDRKRPIDVVLLSVGGNDVGFGALVAYAITSSASDIAPVAGLIGHEIRYSPSVSEAYLRVLDRRMLAVKDALRDGFGVDPSRVLQNAYEPIQFDETGNVCGRIPTLGLDVYPKFRYDSGRVQEVTRFVAQLEARRRASTTPASPAVRQVSPQAAAPASSSSPTTPPNSRTAAYARAIRTRR